MSVATVFAAYRQQTHVLESSEPTPPSPFEALKRQRIDGHSSSLRPSDSVLLSMAAYLPASDSASARGGGPPLSATRSGRRWRTLRRRGRVAGANRRRWGSFWLSPRSCLQLPSSPCPPITNPVSGCSGVIGAILRTTLAIHHVEAQQTTRLAYSTSQQSGPEHRMIFPFALMRRRTRLLYCRSRAPAADHRIGTRYGPTFLGHNPYFELSRHAPVLVFACASHSFASRVLTFSSHS